MATSVNIVLTVPSGTRVMSAGNDTPIPTSNRGSVPASELVAGDRVITDDGARLLIESVSPAEEV